MSVDDNALENGIRLDIWRCIVATTRSQQWCESSREGPRMKLCLAKSLLRTIALLVLSWACFAQLCFAETWVSKTRTHYLIDEATGKPLLTRPDGRPEVFSSTQDSPLLFSVHTEVSFEREAQSSGEKFPALNAGERYKIRGKDQWVRVEDCCHDYSWVKAQYLSGWTDYHRDITRWLVNFGFTPDGLPEKLDGCYPFVHDPVFLYDPVKLKPRWTKLYAVARKGYDGAFRSCEEREAYVYSYATIESTHDEEAVWVGVNDATPVNGRSLLVDARTGEIVGPNPGGFKAIDAFELLRYKDAFLRKNPCPLLSGSDKARYESLFYLADKHKLAAKTKAGRCYLDRLKRYEHDVIRHFLGEPTESLEP